MALDGIVLRALTHQLHETLVEGRIDKITQPDPEDLVFQIHRNRETCRLLISVSSAHPRVGLTAEKRENPVTAPLFCMLLRKHLSGARILSVRQTGLDRILTIDTECRDEMGYPTAGRLHVELMGKHSNLIFFNTATGRIIDSVHRVGESMSRVRQIHPGLLFEALPRQKACLLDLEDPQTETLLAATQSRTLSGAMIEAYEGFSQLMVRELLHRDALEDLPRDRWTPLLMAQVSDMLRRFRQLLLNHAYEPAMIRGADGSPVDFSILPLTHLLGPGMTAEPYPSVSALIETFYSEKSREARLKAKSAALRKLLGTRMARLEKKLQKLQEDFYYAENADASRELGDLLMANLYLASKGMNALTVTDFFHPDQPERTIPLDVRLSPSDNAQRFYRKYSKLRTAQEQVQKQMQETREELSYLDAVLTAVDTSREPSDIEAVHAELVSQGYARPQRHDRGRKKKDTFSPLCFNSPEGFEILVGRNNLENDRLTLKTASNSDLWLHTKELPGSHVIIRTQGRTVPEETVSLAARIAVWHSKGRQGENVAVDCTAVRHVRKVPGARPGMVIYDHQRTLFVTADERELLKLQAPR